MREDLRKKCNELLEHYRQARIREYIGYINQGIGDFDEVFSSKFPYGEFLAYVFDLLTGGQKYIEYEHDRHLSTDIRGNRVNTVYLGNTLKVYFEDEGRVALVCGCDDPRVYMSEELFSAIDSMVYTATNIRLSKMIFFKTNIPSLDIVEYETTRKSILDKILDDSRICTSDIVEAGALFIEHSRVFDAYIKELKSCQKNILTIATNNFNRFYPNGRDEFRAIFLRDFISFASVDVDKEHIRSVLECLPSIDTITKAYMNSKSLLTMKNRYKNMPFIDLSAISLGYYKIVENVFKDLILLYHIDAMKKIVIGKDREEKLKHGRFTLGEMSMIYTVDDKDTLQHLNDKHVDIDDMMGRIGVFRTETRNGYVHKCIMEDSDVFEKTLLDSANLVALLIKTLSK